MLPFFTDNNYWFKKKRKKENHLICKTRSFNNTPTLTEKWLSPVFLQREVDIKQIASGRVFAETRATKDCLGWQSCPHKFLTAPLN